MDLSFKPLDNHRTYVNYYVKYIKQLTRPASTLITDKVDDIQVTKKRGDYHQTVVIKDTSTIRKIVVAINQLSVDQRMTHGCASDNGTRYIIKLTIHHKLLSGIYNPACSSLSFEQTVFLANQKANLSQALIALF